MDSHDKPGDGRVVWVDFAGRRAQEERPAQANVHPPGSRTAPPGNPDVDRDALAKSLAGLERAGGGI
jgi:hypothetical protein